MSKSKKSKKSKKSNHSKRTKQASQATPFSLCRLAYPFVALSISKSPFLWSERLLDDIGTDAPWISGTDIELPLVENEYRVEPGEYNNMFFPHFLMYMDSLASCRLLRFSGCNDYFICTDADEMTVNVALAFARQFSD